MWDASVHPAPWVMRWRQAQGSHSQSVCSTLLSAAGRAWHGTIYSSSVCFLPCLFPSIYNSFDQIYSQTCSLKEQVIVHIFLCSSCCAVTLAVAAALGFRTWPVPAPVTFLWAACKPLTPRSILHGATGIWIAWGRDLAALDTAKILFIPFLTPFEFSICNELWIQVGSDWGAPAPEVCTRPHSNSSTWTVQPGFISHLISHQILGELVLSCFQPFTFTHLKHPFFLFWKPSTWLCSCWAKWNNRGEGTAIRALKESVVVPRNTKHFCKMMLWLPCVWKCCKLFQQLPVSFKCKWKVHNV